jgi:hypothetical protein
MGGWEPGTRASRFMERADEHDGIALRVIENCGSLGDGEGRNR